MSKVTLSDVAFTIRILAENQRTLDEEIKALGDALMLAIHKREMITVSLRALAKDVGDAK